MFNLVNQHKARGAITALLAEYEKSIALLKSVIENITDTELAAIADKSTADENCKSIQTILAHVVSSGFSYCIYIQNSRNIESKRPVKIIHTSAAAFIKNLDDVVQFTNDTFAHIFDDELEEFDEAKKIKTSWGQVYDIEQMMEHAIVHILRHRRQVERFKILLRTNKNS